MRFCCLYLSFHSEPCFHNFWWNCFFNMFSSVRASETVNFFVLSVVHWCHVCRFTHLICSFSVTFQNEGAWYVGSWFDTVVSCCIAKNSYDISHICAFVHMADNVDDDVLTGSFPAFLHTFRVVISCIMLNLIRHSSDIHRGPSLSFCSIHWQMYLGEFSKKTFCVFGKDGSFWTCRGRVYPWLPCERCLFRWYCIRCTALIKRDEVCRDWEDAVWVWTQRLLE